MKLYGPGKYDDLCTYVRTEAEAVAAFVIVLEGKEGNGFSVQTLEPALLPVLPALLEQIARQIRQQNQKDAN